MKGKNKAGWSNVAMATGYKQTQATMVQMRAVVYEGPFKVSIKHVEKPTIKHPNDVIVKGTSPVMHRGLVCTMTDAVPSPHQSPRLASVEGTSTRSVLLSNNAHSNASRVQ